MEVEKFQRLVARLDKESATAPRVYRAKVAALALLGFGILALLLGAVGLGLLLLLGVAVAIALSGGTALLLLLKFGKLLILLAWPLWLLMKSAVRALFIRLPAPGGREVRHHEAPALFAELDRMRERLRGPRVHHVRIVDSVNAAVVQRPAFGLIGWPRNHLLLGLPLLEALPPDEALAVVAHEYGHLAGAHGRFSAFIYRLRLTWGVVQAYAEHIQGWLGRLVAPLVRWYAPYFNAYTFVLARADEYAADACAADLVGATQVTRALKRVNLVAPSHDRFMRLTFDRIDDDPKPPEDIAQRWAVQAGRLPVDADMRRWLADALDRQGLVTDTHPTLRARLAALHAGDAADDDLPPAVSEASAASRWLGELLPRIRAEFASEWVERVATPWSDRHAQVRQMRERLLALRAMSTLDVDQQIELLRLALRLEAESDHRDALASFNTRHPDHPMGLFLEGVARLDRGERAGLALLDRAMALDPQAIKPACERAQAFLLEHQGEPAAQPYAERWRQRDQWETLRAHQLDNIDGSSTLVDAGFDAEQREALRQRLGQPALRHVAHVYVARRVIDADPTAVQCLLGVELSWWGRRRARQQAVVKRLAQLDWPLPLVVINLDGRYARLRRKFRQLPNAQLA